ncbi:MAG: hypothetical protein LBF37_02490, partial [Rickettsiales bacterium]|nr:hypothetical protein [Rickettsiales bacterium]
MKKKIIFSGFMAAILLSAGANAAQIASKEYVDAQNTAQTTTILDTVDTKLANYSTTTDVNTSITNIVASAINDAVNDVDTDVASKADKVNSATSGNLAGLDGSGNLTDSGISPTSIQTSISAKADTSDLKALAKKDTVATDDIDAAAVTAAKIATNAVITAGIADGNVTKAKLASEVQTSLGKADSALQSADISGLATQTDVTNSL